MFLSVTVLVLEEQSLYDEVSCERYHCDAESREGASESLTSGEGTGISPCLTVARPINDSRREQW